MAVSDRVQLLEDGPWTEMVDALAPTARKEGAYLYGQNVYPLTPDVGEGLVGRPGTWQLGDRLVTFPNFIQGIAPFSYGATPTTVSGTNDVTVAVAGGEIYTLDWGTETWTKVVTTANLATKGATLSAVNLKIAFLVVTDQLLISDGFNTPILWNGSAGSAGITLLSACPPLFGQPTLHESRVFGIKDTDRRTMVWSEADDPTTGYEAGGKNNAWTVRQTNPRPLTRLVGTNNGLVIFRERSITIAVGDVGPNFSTTISDDAIDGSIGTKTPFAVIERGPNIIFLDADCHPYMIRPGGVGAVPLWPGLKQTLLGGDVRAIGLFCMAVDYSPANLVLFAIPNGRNDASVGTLVVYDVSRDTPVPVGIWTGWSAMGGTQFTAMAMVLDVSEPNAGGTPRLLLGDYGSNGGYIYALGNPDDESFVTDDSMTLGIQPIEHIVECQALGYSVKREKIFDRIDVSARGNTPMTLEVSATSARGITADPQTIVMGPEGDGWDVGTWDVMEWDATPDYSFEDHGDVGIDLQSRWIRPKVRHETLGEQFGLVAISVTAYATDDDPEVP